MRNLGAYVSCAGGLKNGILNGEELNINTIMMHPSPPQRWMAKPFEDSKIEEFNDAFKNSAIVKRVHLHCIYLINLANPDDQKFHLTKITIQNYLELAEKIDSEGPILHTGSFKDIEPEDGFKRIVKGLEWVFENSKSSKPVLLEVAAGAGRVVGAKLEDLAKIRDMSSHPDRVKFCLDTQHLWASGYDLDTDLDGFLENVEKTLGIENIHCVHFNDSKTEKGSNRDRHENLGEGLIGEQTMKNFLNHPKLKSLDFVMETPAMKSAEDGMSQVEILKKWAED